ncbi:MAG: hypothetical protein PHG85_05275, partial [Candidatus Altiarchaeota archaeon]|nr:hypothetical protein [Candidatus Altiarchaeota archaeon]
RLSTPSGKSSSSSSSSRISSSKASSSSSSSKRTTTTTTTTIVTRLFVKEGNQFSSASESYATATHCTSGTCGWVVGDQVIVGVYLSDPGTWSGTVTWNFNLSTLNLTRVQSARLNITRPNYYGKGLHSTLNTGTGTVKVGASEIARHRTNITQCGADWFAHECGTLTLNYTIPVNYLTANTPITLNVTSKTAWDVDSITLILTTA